MKTALAALVCCVAAAGGDIEGLGYQWAVQDAADWSVTKDGGTAVMHLLRKGEPGVPRRPTKFAIAETPMFRKVTVEVEMLREGRSLIIVYGWQDKDHWNYAHVSSDEAKKQNVHNGMFHVFGGERVRISSLDGPSSFAETPAWTPVKLVFDGESGRCHVEVNGRRNPSLEAVDLSLRHGRVGLGSFNETGSFRNLRIQGEPVR